MEISSGNPENENDTTHTPFSSMLAGREDGRGMARAQLTVHCRANADGAAREGNMSGGDVLQNDALNENLGRNLLSI